MQLHEKIGLLRRIKGWSQEEMSEKLSMSPNGYAKIERGETDVQWSRLGRIAQILGIDMKDLVAFDDRTVFNVVSSHDQSYLNNYVQSAKVQGELENELRETRLLLEQKDKEIACLREINALLREKSLENSEKASK